MNFQKRSFFSGRSLFIVLPLVITMNVVHADDCARGILDASPAMHFAQALQLRSKALEWGERKKSELEIAHALREIGTPRLAHSAYLSILKDSEAENDVRTQALLCMNRLERAWPLLHRPLPDSLLQELSLISATHAAEAPEYLFRELNFTLRQEPTRSKTVAQWLLKQAASSPEARLAQGFILARDRKPLEAYRFFQEFLSQTTVPDSLERHRNAVRLLAARTAFAIGKPTEAAQLLRSVDKSSNLAPASLEELTWSLLESERPGEAIGTALQLERGLMNRTFAPEAPMVLAISLTELCQFPAALKTMTRFKRHWEPIAVWLENWNQRHESVLPLTRKLLRREKQPGLPSLVGWELVQAPSFLSHESFLVQVRLEEPGLMRLSNQLQKEQLLLAGVIIESAANLTQKIRSKPEQITADTEKELRSLRQKWLDYKALRKAMPPLKKIMAHSKKQTPQIRAQMESILEVDLQRRLSRMRQRLSEVTENLSLVEIEILDGASRDLVWQNAHPELAKKAREMIAANTKRAEKTWNWGSAFTALDTEQTGDTPSEIWEDELGSHEVLIADRCKLQERHAALERSNP